MRKNSFSIIGNKISVSKSNSNWPSISHHTLSTMAHPSLPVLLTTAISPQVPSRTSSADMPRKPVITFLEDSDGIATDSLLSTKSIRNLKSPTRGKFFKWESPSIIKNAETLSWSILKNGKALLEDLEDGLISRTITRLLTSSSWSQSGTSSSNSLKRVSYTEEEKLCLTPTPAPQYCQTLKSNSITRKSATHLFTSVSHWLKIITWSSWSGLPPHGHCHPTWPLQSSLKWIISRSWIPKEMKYSSWQNPELRLFMERIKRPLKFLISSKERIWKEKNTFPCLISFLIERPRDASRSSVEISLLKIQVPVLCIALQDSVKKITKSVSPKESSIQMIHQCLWTKTVNSQKNVLHTRDFTSKMPTK